MQHMGAGLHNASSTAAVERGGLGAATSGAPPPAARSAQAAKQQRRHASWTAAVSAAAPAASDACPVSAAAFSTALDASADLQFTWLSHWQQQEARRAARRSLIDATRGRQQQRLRQVATLLSSPGTDMPSSSRPGIAEQLLAPSAGVVGGSSSSSSSSRARGAEEDNLSSLDLPSLQEMSELDELTWLASHPPEGDAAEGGGGGGMPLWSHQQHQNGRQQQQHEHQHQQQLLGLAAPGTGSVAVAAQQGPVTLRVGQDVLSVRPLWIAAYQPDEGGPAKLFETVSPLLPDLVGRLSADIAPFCSVAGMSFSAGAADAAGGGWRNYFIGLVGSVAADEDDILWPNQVLHRDRVLFNVRNGWDVARFLSDPRREDVEAHRDNLARLAAERGYRRGWCGHMLRLRWGAATLRALGVEPC
ncbi:hypothetical protein ABPG77_001524 [Micractinium sp. CCAP 211/92]